MVIECAISNGNGGFINCEDFQPPQPVIVETDDFFTTTYGSSSSSTCERSVIIDASVINTQAENALITSTVDDGPSNVHKVFAGYTVRISSIEKTIDVCKIVDSLQVFKISVEATTFMDQNEETIPCGMIEKAVVLTRSRRNKTVNLSTSPKALTVVASAPLTDKYEYAKKGSTINPGSPNDSCGQSVDISGNNSYVIIGCPDSSNNGLTRTGSTQIFSFSPSAKKWERYSNWVIQGEITDDQSGIQVSFAEDAFVVAIAAPNEGKGKVRVYDAFNRKQMGQDIILDETKNNILEPTLDLSKDGKTLLVGSNSLGGLLKRFTFDQNQNNWSQVDRLSANHTAICGTSVSLADDGKSYVHTILRTETKQSRMYYKNQLGQVYLDFTEADPSIPMTAKLSGDGLVGARISRIDGIVQFYDMTTVFENNAPTLLGSYTLEAADNCGSSFDLSYDGKIAVIGCSKKVEVIKFSDITWTPIWTLFEPPIHLDARNTDSTVALSKDGRTIVAGLEVFALVPKAPALDLKDPLKTPKSPSSPKSPSYKGNKAPKKSKSPQKDKGKNDENYEETDELCNVPLNAKKMNIEFDVGTISDQANVNSLNDALCHQATNRRRLGAAVVKIESMFISSIEKNNEGELSLLLII